MENNEKLSQDDIKSLMNNPDPDAKIKVIEKLAQQYNQHDFTESQIKLAEQIFRLLLKQAEIQVRKALSENIMYSKSIPKDVVFELARDVEEVSLPILEFSEILNDDELVNIISSTDKAAKHVAITKRQHVSEAVSSALIDTNNEVVVGNLLENENATINDRSYNKIISSFSDNESVVDSMITRGSIPPKIISTLVNKVSQQIKSRLEHKYSQNFNEINDFFKESSEVAAFKFMGMQSVDESLMDLIDDLERTGKLNTALDPSCGMLSHLLDGLEQLGQLTPLSALAQGHDVLFEITLSRFTSVPFENVRKLVADEKGGLRALYNQAQLPPKLFEAVQLVINVIKKMNQDALKNKTSGARDNRNLMIKNIMSESSGKNISNIAHVISIIRHHLENSQSDW